MVFFLSKIYNYLKMIYLFIFSATIGAFAYKLFLKNKTFQAFLVSKGFLKSKTELLNTTITEFAPEIERNANRIPNVEGEIVEEIKDITVIYHDELSKHSIDILKIQDSPTPHHYKNIKSLGDYTTKAKRLMSEIKQMSNFLPTYYTNSIFVRYDENHMNLMKSVIMGADDTPYAHGAFLYDISFESDYPEKPPKVNLMTTGNGTIRFNPNLYNNGYVCLSLLGTWSGAANEMWSNKSNLLQVLISIQSLVMIEGIIYNEPSYYNGRKSKTYQNMDNGYTNIVKYGNVKYAMNEQLKNPSIGFEQAIKLHFYYKKNDILKTVHKWLAEAEAIKNEKGLIADYSGLVSSHNYTIANLFSKGKEVYYNELKKEVEILEELLKNIKL